MARKIVLQQRMVEVRAYDVTSNNRINYPVHDGTSGGRERGAALAAERQQVGDQGH